MSLFLVISRNNLLNTYKRLDNYVVFRNVKSTVQKIKLFIWKKTYFLIIWFITINVDFSINKILFDTFTVNVTYSYIFFYLVHIYTIL